MRLKHCFFVKVGSNDYVKNSDDEDDEDLISGDIVVSNHRDSF